jgi:hypothetical protein
MSNGLNKPSVRAAASNALHKIDSIEKQQAQIVFATNRAIGILQNQTSHMAEIQDAIVRILGEENVAKAVLESRTERAEAMDDSKKQDTVKKLEEGTLVSEDTIRAPNGDDQGSMIESVDYDENGDRVAGSYNISFMSNIKPEFRDSLIGKSVGTEIAVPKLDNENNPVLNEKGEPVSGKTVIVGVYRKLEKAILSPEAQAQVAAKAAEATTEAPPAVSKNKLPKLLKQSRQNSHGCSQGTD